MASKYVDNTTVTFVPNFRSNNNNTEVTITSYNTQYMTLQEDPDGIHTITVNVQKQKSYIPTNGNADGFFYQVSNPTSAMISTGSYYNSSGTLCTSTSGCSPAYKLIHYDDDVLNSAGDTISKIEEDGTGNVIDATKYYYLVTRDLNILRYTSGAISYYYLNSTKPFTITGTAVNGTSISGRITLYDKDSRQEKTEGHPPARDEGPEALPQRARPERQAQQQQPPQQPRGRAAAGVRGICRTAL